jgi:hypothetical protein
MFVQEGLSCAEASLIVWRVVLDRTGGMLAQREMKRARAPVPDDHRRHVMMHDF